MSDLPSLSALEAAHQFPCWYTVKIFGPGHDQFHEDLRATVLAFAAEPSHVRTVSRPSGAGKFQCVTLQYQATNPQDVLDLYGCLRTVDEIRMMM